MQSQGLLLCMLTVHYKSLLWVKTFLDCVGFNSLQGGLKSRHVLSKITFFSKKGERLEMGVQDDQKKHFYEAYFCLKY